MNWICVDCTAAYSVGARSCPQCGSTKYVEEGMAKISRLGGATVEGDLASATEVVESEPELVEEPVEVEESAVPVSPGEPYDTWLLVDLQEECVARGLAKTGNKPDLVQRLIDADAATEDGLTETEEDAPAQ